LIPLFLQISSAMTILYLFPCEKGKTNENNSWTETFSEEKESVFFSNLSK